MNDVAGVNKTQARDDLLPILEGAFPEYWELLGKEIRYKVCMKNVTWLNDPNHNSSQLAHPTLIDTRRHLLLEATLMLMDTRLSMASHPSPLWTSLALSVEECFLMTRNIFLPLLHSRLDLPREYNASGNCVKTTF